MSSTPISPGDAAYPAAVRELLRAPPTIYLRGRLPERRGLAIVGTRSPSAPALAFTRTLARELSHAQFAIWSGGALGIDAAAHEATLEAHGVTVLVAGGGLDRPYPAEHRGLYDRIVASGGGLVARVPDGTPPRRACFLQRNELLAVLTEATVVVEAGLVSGARSTAAAARRLGRPLCVVPHAPWVERGQGCAAELVRGAIPVTSTKEVLAALNEPRRPAGRRPLAPLLQVALTLELPGAHTAAMVSERPAETVEVGLGTPLDSAPAPPPLEDHERAVLDVITSLPTHVDEACERAALPQRLVVGALLTLTLRSIVVEGPAGFFRKVTLPPAPSLERAP